RGDSVPLEVVPVAALGERAGALAARFFGDPSSRQRVIGVTGTNGKTTCTQLLAQAFGLLDRRCGVIGTLGWGFPGNLADTGHTTPDPVTMQRALASLGEQGANLVAVEMSSHALKQGRTRSVHIDTAVFTNLTHDHLDYHGTLEDYGASKKLLFETPGLRFAVVNADDAFGATILAGTAAGTKVISYGLTESSAQVRASAASYSVDGLRAWVETPWGSGELRAPLMGRFNLSNALAVLSVLGLHEVALADALAIFPRLRAVPGRMERIGVHASPLAIVDYAHTPDALEHTLRALREHCSGRLWCVFGCGGDRDRTKRPLMGRIAWEHADELVITSDNPRSESAAAIIDEICTGVPGDGARREPDRAQAIRLALGAAGPGDCVLIAGKGHENYQETNGVRVPFSDADTVRRLFAEAGAGS
ncbi:MAG: UDP-N-acetylmuramoyl-L-alanyl-D-glutamate--2,6-diaminopimelate ligase, partial [Pseudomonadales bacterium]